MSIIDFTNISHNHNVYLWGDNLRLSGSHRFLSIDLLFALLGEDCVRKGDCLDFLSWASGDLLCLKVLSCSLGVRLLVFGLRAGRRPGERFSLPEEASLDGDLRTFFSFSESDLLSLRSLDFDFFSLDLLLLGTGDFDFIFRSLVRVSLGTGDFLRSLDLTLSVEGDFDFIIFSGDCLRMIGDFFSSRDLVRLDGLLDFLRSFDILLGAFSNRSELTLGFLFSVLCFVFSFDLLLDLFLEVILESLSRFALAFDFVEALLPLRIFSLISPSSSDPEL